jgi:hypothetical protein
MAFDLAMMDLMCSHQRSPFHDKDITIVMFQRMPVTIVNFPPISHVNTKCNLIALAT